MFMVFCSDLVLYSERGLVHSSHVTKISGRSLRGKKKVDHCNWSRYFLVSDPDKRLFYPIAVQGGSFQKKHSVQNHDNSKSSDPFKISIIVYLKLVNLMC